MDPIENPFAPGAGSRPPELAGRTMILENATIALKRTRAGRHAKSQMLLGLRGVGKTVLLNRIAEIAEGERYLTTLIEAPEGQRLAPILAPQLRVVLFKLSGVEKAKVLANRAMAFLRSFATVFKVADFDAGTASDVETTASGHLPTDLANLMVAVGMAAKAADKPVAIFIDEVQFLVAADLAAVIASAHQISLRALPLMIFGAGLPQPAGLAGDARSYAERLFEFPPLGPLDTRASEAAVREPIHKAGAAITPEALRLIVEQTEGYAYFLQEWGHHSWDVAPKSPIELADVKAAAKRATEALDASFFRVRFDRLTPREKDYLRAMAEMGPGPHRSGDVAAAMNIDVTIAGPLRTGLIRKGMVYSPDHGLTAFTVPMFDAFMRRAVRRRRPKKE